MIAKIRDQFARFLVRIAWAIVADPEAIRVLDPDYQ